MNFDPDSLRHKIRTALVENPSLDANHFCELYPEAKRDTVNRYMSQWRRDMKMDKAWELFPLYKVREIELESFKFSHVDETDLYCKLKEVSAELLLSKNEEARIKGASLAIRILALGLNLDIDEEVLNLDELRKIGKTIYKTDKRAVL